MYDIPNTIFNVAVIFFSFKCLSLWPFWCSSYLSIQPDGFPLQLGSVSAKKKIQITTKDLCNQLNFRTINSSCHFSHFTDFSPQKFYAPLFGLHQYVFKDFFKQQSERCQFQQQCLHIVSHVAYLDIMNTEQKVNVKREVENKNSGVWSPEVVCPHPSKCPGDNHLKVLYVRIAPLLISYHWNR